MGTIWPRPNVFHLSLTAEVMQALTAFLEVHPAGYFCTHCHVYSDGRMLLQWHDAFGSDPMYISRVLEGDHVRDFAAKLGSTLNSNTRALLERLRGSVYPSVRSMVVLMIAKQEC